MSPTACIDAKLLDLYKREHGLLTELQEIGDEGHGVILLTLEFILFIGFILCILLSFICSPFNITT